MINTHLSAFPQFFSISLISVLRSSLTFTWEDVFDFSKVKTIFFCLHMHLFSSFFFFLTLKDKLYLVSWGSISLCIFVPFFFSLSLSCVRKSSRGTAVIITSVENWISAICRVEKHLLRLTFAHQFCEHPFLKFNNPCSLKYR